MTMPNPIEMMKEILKHMLDQKRFNYCDILTVMVLSRQVLEMRGLGKKSSFDLLKFYCDWCVHFEMSRSIHCVGILEEVTNILIQYSSETDMAIITKEVSKAISLDTLRKELSDLYASEGISTVLFSDRNWKNFSELLVGVLLDKKVNILNTSRYSELVVRTENIIFQAPFEFWFSKITPEEVRKTRYSRKTVLWNVTVFKNEAERVRICGVLRHSK